MDVDSAVDRPSPVHCLPKFDRRPLGGFNDCNIPDGGCLQEFCTAISGPLMHLPLIFSWVIVMTIAAPEGVTYYGTVGFDIDRLDEGGAREWFAQLAKRSLDVNVMIFALNLLLPVHPLDAASMVAALCGKFGLSRVRSAWVLLIIGAVLGAAVLLVGILYIVAGSGPGVFLLLMGLYVIYTSWQMHSQIQDGTIHSHPIFKPDCYHRDQTNLSSSTPAARSSLPVSPRKARRSQSAPTKNETDKNNGDTSRANDQPPPREGKRGGGDIEMGNRASPVKSTSSKKKAPAAGNSASNPSPGPKKSPPKKKAPSKKKPSSGN
jgi:hypothetical protein